jgi:hypothetical protein
VPKGNNSKYPSRHLHQKQKESETVIAMGMHLMGMYLMGVHLMGVHLMGVYLMSMHLISLCLIPLGGKCGPPLNL